MGYNFDDREYVNGRLIGRYVPINILAEEPPELAKLLAVADKQTEVVSAIEEQILALELEQQRLFTAGYEEVSESRKRLLAIRAELEELGIQRKLERLNEIALFVEYLEAKHAHHKAKGAERRLKATRYRDEMQLIAEELVKPHGNAAGAHVELQSAARSEISTLHAEKSRLENELKAVLTPLKPLSQRWQWKGDRWQ